MAATEVVETASASQPTRPEREAPVPGLRTVLVVDDDERFRRALADALRSRGYEVETSSSCDDALDRIGQAKPDLAIFDLRLPPRGGLWLLRAAAKIHPDLKAIVVTGYSAVASAVDAIRLGALDYLPKPLGVDDILRAYCGNGRAKELETDPASSAGWTVPSLQRLEWEHINRVLTECHGNITHAARMLGMHRQSLQRKLRKFPPAW